MKNSKKFLSVLLSVLIVLSSLGVGFYAIAADDVETDTEKDAAVAAVEESITGDWYNTHRSYLYSTKEEDTELKQAARDAFNSISAKMKALTEAQKLEMNRTVYMYWIGVVQDDFARELSGKPTSSPSTEFKIQAFKEKKSDIEALVGDFPQAFEDAITALAPAEVVVDGTNTISSTKVNYKDNELAQSTVQDLLDNIKGMSYEAITFADYLYLTSGSFYVYAFTPTSARANETASSVITILFNLKQDLMTESGSSPSSVYYSQYVTRTKQEDGSYKYEWKSGQSGQTYVDAFNTYFEATKTDVVAPAKAAIDTLFEAFTQPEYKGVKESINTVITVGTEVLETGKAEVADIEAMVSEVEALSDTARGLYDEVSGSYTLKVAAKIENVYTADTVTPELAYTKSTKVNTYSAAGSSGLYKMATDILEALKLEEFIDYVNGVDLENVTEEIATTARDMYVSLSDDFKEQIPAEAFANYMAIVKPVADPYDYAKEVEGFKPTKIVRPQNSEVAMTVGGIQSAVDELWNLVANTLLPLLAPEIDLSDGLDKVLEDNLYQPAIIEAIFDLYATLSHDKTEVEGFELGTIIGMIISPDKVANALEEEKFAGAVEKIKAIPDMTEEEKEQGMTELDQLAALTFTAEDFGFKAGERDGFIDALLASLRPITTLLAPGSKVIIIEVGVNMFDYIDGEGNYVNGVYSNLIPLLEQLGCTSLPTAAEYKANYESVKAASGANIAADEFLRPVIDSLFNDVVDLVSPDPLNGLIKVLPRLAYIVDQDMINPTLQAAFAQMGMLSGLAGSLDLSKEAINGMITGAVIDLTSVAGTDCKITLKEIDWAALANCCTVESHKSVSNSNEYFILRTGETDTCFTTVFYYLYDVLFADAANYKSLTTLLNSVVGSLGAIGDLVMGYVVGWHDAGAVEAYGSILDMLGTPGDTPIEPDEPTDPEDPDPEDPTDPEDPDDGKPGDGGSGSGSTDDDKKPNLNPPTNSKNPLIPNTGAEEVASFCLSTVVIGAAVALVILSIMRKKKTN